MSYYTKHAKHSTMLVQCIVYTIYIACTKHSISVYSTYRKPSLGAGYVEVVLAGEDHQLLLRLVVVHAHHAALGGQLQCSGSGAAGTLAPDAALLVAGGDFFLSGGLLQRVTADRRGRGEWELEHGTGSSGVSLAGSTAL